MRRRAFEAALLAVSYHLLILSLSFALQPEGARRAAQITYFVHCLRCTTQVRTGKNATQPELLENNITRPSGRGREPSAPEPYSPAATLLNFGRVPSVSGVWSTRT